MSYTVRMNTNLFVGGFPYQTTEEELGKFFSQCGLVLKVKILTDGETGRSRGIGFVLMATAEGAQAALAKLNGAQLGARKVFVTEAKVPPKPVQRSLGGYADKPGFVERRSGKDRRQNPPPFAAQPPADAPAEERRGRPQPWERPGYGGPKKWDKVPGEPPAPGAAPAPSPSPEPEKKWGERKPGGFGGPKKWGDKKPGGFGGPKKWGDKKPGGPGGPKKWDDKKPGGFGGPKKWGDKKPGGFGGPKKWGDRKPGGFRKGPRKGGIDKGGGGPRA